MGNWKAIALGTALTLAVATPAAAVHDHYLVTPSNCVSDIARGQTAKAPGEGGHHKFHENVHLGMPGTKAFANERNPVSVHRNDPVTGAGCPAGQG